MKETRWLPLPTVPLLVVALLGTLLACRGKLAGERRKSVLSGLTAAEVASAQRQFRTAAADLPKCATQTPFLCDVLGKGQKGKADRYAECLALPEIHAFGCTRIQPIVFDCLPTPPAAAECRVPDTQGPIVDEETLKQLTGEAVQTKEREGFASWRGMAPTMSIYLVRDPAVGTVRGIRKPSELGALYRPLDSAGKALALAALVKGRPEWLAAERDEKGWRVWLLGRASHAGCGRDQIVQSEVRVGADGKVTGVRDVGIPVGAERCAD